MAWVGSTAGEALELSRRSQTDVLGSGLAQAG